MIAETEVEVRLLSAYREGGACGALAFLATRVVNREKAALARQEPQTPHPKPQRPPGPSRPRRRPMPTNVIPLRAHV